MVRGAVKSHGPRSPLPSSPAASPAGRIPFPVVGSWRHAPVHVVTPQLASAQPLAVSSGAHPSRPPNRVACSPQALTLLPACASRHGRRRHSGGGVDEGHSPTARGGSAPPPVWPAPGRHRHPARRCRQCVCRCHRGRGRWRRRRRPLRRVVRPRLAPGLYPHPILRRLPHPLPTPSQRAEPVRRGDGRQALPVLCVGAGAQGGGGGGCPSSSCVGYVDLCLAAAGVVWLFPGGAPHLHVCVVPRGYALFFSS